MSYQGKKITGVWMDNKHAFIISTANRNTGSEYAMLKKIDRETHEDEKYKNERFELAKEKMELKKYFKALADEVEKDEVIFIFGPGKIQEEFKNVLKDNHLFKSKTIEIGSSAKLSINQMITRVMEHFERIDQS
jgi:hypothetical protein